MKKENNKKCMLHNSPNCENCERGGIEEPQNKPMHIQGIKPTTSQDWEGKKWEYDYFNKFAGEIDDKQYGKTLDFIRNLLSLKTKEAYEEGQKDMLECLEGYENPILMKRLKEARTNLTKETREILEDNLLGGFIGEIKTDDNEKLWVRIDNYLGQSPNGEIILIDRKKLNEILSKLSEVR